jgi:hypothetical protein
MPSPTFSTIQYTHHFYSFKTYPLALYTVGHRVDHTQFEGVLLDIRDDMDYLFDRNKSHLAS